MRIVVTSVVVDDQDKALQFYTDVLGMKLETRADEFGWAQFATGSCNLAVERLAPDDPEAPGLVGRYVGISLRVPDLDSTYHALVARGVEFLSPPTKQAWGGTLAHLRDPEGNVLTLLG